jgi:hypothetical protein
MIFDQVARLTLQPAVGPPGPRVLAVLALVVVAGLSSIGRAVVSLCTQARRPQLQLIPVEVRRDRRLSSRH